MNKNTEHVAHRIKLNISEIDQNAQVILYGSRARGDAKNRIKELKQDFGADSFNLKSFFATEAALIFVMVAYNLMSLFRLFVLREKTQKCLSTLRYRTFAAGAYFEKV